MTKSKTTVTLEQIRLTPERAVELLANRHPHQRRTARQMVTLYARTIKEGRWKLIDDPIMLDSEGRMFNGSHRCEAVILAKHSIPVYLHRDADPEMFDAIDGGRRRSAYQFIDAQNATIRASAAKVILWYERRFDQQMNAQTLSWDVHEVLETAAAYDEEFTTFAPIARRMYDLTSISASLITAVLSLAARAGYADEASLFAHDVIDPTKLDPSNAARVLSERFRKQGYRTRKRQLNEDWTLLVRALNLYLEDRPAPKTMMVVDTWPAIGEPEAEFNRRRRSVVKSRQRARPATTIPTGFSKAGNELLMLSVPMAASHE